MFVLFALSAEAGSIDLVLSADGHTSEVSLSGVAPCASHSLSRDEPEGAKVELDARVEPTGDGLLRVHLDVDRSGWNEGGSRLKMRPTLLVKDGKKEVLSMNIDGAVATLEVKVKGFDDGPTCPLESVRRVRQETRRTRSSE